MIVTLLDETGSPIAGEQVEILLVGATAPVEVRSIFPISDANGRAQFELSTSHAQSITIFARIAATGVVLFDSAPLTFYGAQTDPTHSTLTADPLRVTADGSDTTTLTVTLRDAADNPVADHQVVIVHNGVDVAVTTANRSATPKAGWCSPPPAHVAQDVRFQAVDLTAAVQLDAAVDVSFVSTDPDLSTAVIEPAELVADGAATATLTATLVNASGAPMAGVDVSLAVSPNQGVTINGVAAPAGPVSLGLTDDQGIVTAQISATKAGVKTLTVRDETEGVTLTQRPTVTFLHGPPDAAQSVVTAIDRVVAADGLAQSLVLVTVSDAFGNRVAGATVELLTSSDAVPIQPAAPTDSLGQARGYVTDVNGRDRHGARHGRRRADRRLRTPSPSAAPIWP